MMYNLPDIVHLIGVFTSVYFISLVVGGLGNDLAKTVDDLRYSGIGIIADPETPLVVSAIVGIFYFLGFLYLAGWLATLYFGI